MGVRDNGTCMPVKETAMSASTTTSTMTSSISLADLRRPRWERRAL